MRQYRVEVAATRETVDVASGDNPAEALATALERCYSCNAETDERRVIVDKHGARGRYILTPVDGGREIGYRAFYAADVESTKHVRNGGDPAHQWRADSTDDGPERETVTRNDGDRTIVTVA